MVIFRGHGRQVDARENGAWLFGKGPSASNDCIRTIAFQSVGGSLMGRETKNNVLQKALTLYLTEANVPFEQRAQVSLTALRVA